MHRNHRRQKIPKTDYAFLFESVEGQEKIARYSFLGSNPSLIFKSKGRNIEIIDPLKRKMRKFTTNQTPLDELKKIMEEKSMKTFTDEEIADAGYRLAGFAELCFESYKRDCRRKQKLKENPNYLITEG